MQATFITALTNITINAKLGRGDRIDDITFITNELKHVEEYLPPGFNKVVGSLEADFIRNAPAVAYSTDDIPDDTDTFAYLASRHLLLSTLLSMMWLVKDNAVNYDKAFLISESVGSPTRIDSDSMSIKYSTAEGQDPEVKFSRSELQKARRYLRERVSTTRFLDSDVSVAIASPDRIERFTYFLSGARANQDIGLKVSQYCTALEALFATGHAELTHKLAERVAAFLEDDAEARSHIYTIVKQGYIIRSIVIHGGSAKESKEGRFLEGSRQLDGILRNVYSQVLETPEFDALFSLENDMFDSAFLLRVFGWEWEMVLDWISTKKATDP